MPRVFLSKECGSGVWQELQTHIQNGESGSSLDRGQLASLAQLICSQLGHQALRWTPLRAQPTESSVHGRDYTGFTFFHCD